jgi:flagellar motor protein MotB
MSAATGSTSHSNSNSQSTFTTATSTDTSTTVVKLEEKTSVKEEKHSHVKAEALTEDEEDFIEDSAKTVEDLKERFYSIQKLLLQNRNASDPDVKKHAMFKNELITIMKLKGRSS